MLSTATHPYLLLGGTGRTGRRVAARLDARGLPVRVTSRRGQPPFDWHDASTWAASLRGVRRAYLAFHPDVAAPGTAELLAQFTRVAVEHGVRRLVLLSGRGEAAARSVEARVADLVPECVVLRASFFMQDFSEHFLVDAVRAGVISLPAGDTAEPFLDADDLADVAVHALTRDDLVGRTVELTGPQLLTFTEAASALSGAVGRPVRYRPCSVADFTAAAAQQGMPEAEAQVLAEVFAQVFDGRNAFRTDAVADILGRPARRFLDYAQAAAVTGVWGAGLTATRALR